jgi:hypothetical protein
MSRRWEEDEEPACTAQAATGELVFFSAAQSFIYFYYYIAHYEESFVECYVIHTKDERHKGEGASTRVSAVSSAVSASASHDLVSSFSFFTFYCYCFVTSKLCISYFPSFY